MNIVNESLQKFKRNIDSKSGLDVGDRSSYFWPKSLEDLEPEEKEKALETYTAYYIESGQAIDGILSDEFLLEPLHKELVAIFGPNPYSNINHEPLIGFNPDKLYFDLRNKTIDLENSIEINDKNSFLEFLGIPEDIINEISYTIGKDTIEFDIDDLLVDNPAYEFSTFIKDSISRSTHIFDKYINDLIYQIDKQYEYLISDENIELEIKMRNIMFGPDLEMVNESSGAGFGSGGSLQTPQSKRRLTKQEKYIKDELEEEQVHPDDKIGQMMLKKTGTPSYFKSDKKKQTVSQEKVDEKINEMNVHPADQIGQMMLSARGLENYFEIKGLETHQKDVEKVKKKYVSNSYANSKTDAYGDTKGNYMAKMTK